jgi:lantibiotic modifying enzyme
MVTVLEMHVYRFDEIAGQVFCEEIASGLAKVQAVAEVFASSVDGVALQQNAARLLRERVRELSIGPLLQFGFERKRHHRESILCALSRAVEQDCGLSFRTEFSELIRCIAVVCNNLSDQLVQIVERFANDCSDIANALGVDARTLESISAVMSDHHERQSAVFLLKVSGHFIVYKPKSLDADVIFQSTLARVTAHVPRLEFPEVAMLSRAEYGWMGFVEHAPCVDVQELSQFYLRIGYMLSVLVMLRSCDHHYDNLIANKAHPYLIDLECSFTPSLILDKQWPYPMSMRRVGIVSHIDRVDNFEIDKGALAWRDGASTLVLTWRGWGTTGAPELEYKERTIFRSRNDPHKTESILRSQHFRQFLVRGLRDGRRIIRRTSADLKSSLRSVHDQPMRLVLRSTRFYRELLMFSLSPVFCRDSERRSALLKTYLEEDDRRLEPLVAQEIASLMNGEIPHFRHLPGDRVVFSNGEGFQGIIRTPGLELVLRHLPTAA